jgi:Zn-finger nucleic acid-binding protein
MKCPTCREPELLMSDRQGIEIDYCPQCRGVWLDRGELDKIIDRSGSAEAPSRPAPAHRDPHQPSHFDSRVDYKSGYGYRKKKGFLGDLFDFD